MSLKDLYLSWTFRTPTAINTQDGVATPREQANGDVAVDFMSNEFQTEVRNRPFKNTTVTQATEDDKTAGTFTNNALFRYGEKVKDTLLTMYKGKNVHKFNAQGVNPNDKYITSDDIKDTKGIGYYNNP
jgi:hypothetical protein